MSMKNRQKNKPRVIFLPPPRFNAPSPPTPPSYMSVMKAPVMPVFRGEHGNNKWLDMSMGLWVWL